MRRAFVRFLARLGWLSVALLAGSTISAGEGAESCANSAECYGADSAACCCLPASQWYGQVEALFYERDNRTNRVAVIAVQDEGNNFPGDTVLTTGAAEFDFEPGFRALLGWRSDDCHAWELVYFGIFDGDASATASGANDLAIPGNLGLASLDFFAADQITLQYDSRLHNAEVNRVRTCGELSLLAGFRYLSLNEEFNIRGVDLDTGASDYNIRATNNLIGGQIGVRGERVCDCWTFDATGKAGIFGNAASQTQSVTDFPPGFFLRDEVTATGGQVAFVGDLNLSANYRWSDVWSLRAGYNLLWIEGVALAPNQLDFTDVIGTSGTELRTGGGVFLHGVNAGLQANW